MDSQTAAKLIREAKSCTFLTGAGVSTPSGIPDYRSLKGVYHGIQQPEYLLSHTCMVNEPDTFYEFVQHLYHPHAKPNVIHRTIAALETSRPVWTVSQNIDGLHKKAGSHHCIDFHGSLYRCYCRKCGQTVPWETYLTDWHHSACGGQIRPDIVLYEEGFTDDQIEAAISAVTQAELLVVVGTSLQVYPFAGLIQYQQTPSVLVINQTPVAGIAAEQVLARGEDIFALV